MSDTVDTSRVVIDSTFPMEQQQEPSEDHSLFVFKIGTDGKPERGSQGWYKIKTLIDALGQKATEALEMVEQSKQEILNIQNQLEDLLDNFNANNAVGYITTVGDGTSSEFTITHNLGTTKFIFQVWGKNSDEDVPAWRIETIDANTVKLICETVPAADSLDLYFAPIVQYEDINDIPFENLSGTIKPEQIDPSCLMSKEAALEILNGTSN